MYVLYVSFLGENRTFTFPVVRIVSLMEVAIPKSKCINYQAFISMHSHLIKECIKVNNNVNELE